VQTLPDALRRSLTWDQGPEMRDWKQVRVDARIDVYFCDPHAPWQRGSDENTNGLLRQYFPKGTDFSTLTEAELDAVADELNGRPRKRLGFANPTDQLTELLLQRPPESAAPLTAQSPLGAESPGCPTLSAPRYSPTFALLHGKSEIIIFCRANIHWTRPR
jgi:hypothetical protein